MLSFLKKLVLGSPLKNPGYSFDRPQYEWDSKRYVIGTVAWEGPEGGDTFENRLKFVAWLNDTSVSKDNTYHTIEWDDSALLGKPKAKPKKQKITVKRKEG